jgi:hypothetical protein
MLNKLTWKRGHWAKENNRKGLLTAENIDDIGTSILPTSMRHLINNLL